MKKIIPSVEERTRHLLKDLLATEISFTLNNETFEKMCNMAHTITLDKGDLLMSEGDLDSSLYIAFEGILRCWYWNGCREETAAFSTIPTIFQNYHSAFANKGSFYNFEACTPSSLICLPKRAYEQLCASSHNFSLWMLKHAESQFYYYEVRDRLNTGDAKDKYRTLLKELPEISNFVSLQTIASYLRITPQHLSRIRKDI